MLRSLLSEGCMNDPLKIQLKETTSLLEKSASHFNRKFFSPVVTSTLFSFCPNTKLMRFLKPFRLSFTDNYHSKKFQITQPKLREMKIAINFIVHVYLTRITFTCVFIETRLTILQTPSKFEHILTEKN